MLIAGHAFSSIVRSASLVGCSAQTIPQWTVSHNIKLCCPFTFPVTRGPFVPRRARHSTAQLIQELQFPSPVKNGPPRELAPSNSSVGEQDPAATATKPAIRQVNTTRIGKRKSARSQVEKLAIYQRNKDLRNQMLKDRGSWSYDWRISLRDLERYYDPHSSKTEISRFTLGLPGRLLATRNVRADQIPPPSVWTISSFYAYVVQLATSKVDRLISRQIYSKGEIHIVAVADILASLFADPTLKYVVSTEAGNRALQFLFDNEKFARGQDLFGQLQQLQKDKDPVTYNIMLGAAAKQKDLHTFTYILKMMILCGVRPDTGTWLHLAQAVREDEVRMVIINRMAKKGLLSDSVARKEAVALIMPQLVVKWLDSGNDPQGLLEAVDHDYGDQWCSTRAAESMINESGVRRSIREALLILVKLHDRGYQPTEGILLLLLRQCAWSKAYELMVEILGFFRIEYE
ncbi:MAG: hypothetical protein Q9224_005423, partial [Gallowayella concinna]